MAAAAKTISIREEVPSLDDRIADAFEASMSSGDLKALLDEVEQTNVDAQAQSKAAAARALDPKLRPADVAAARQQMQDADFRSKRMEAAAEQLKGLHSKAISREARQRAAEEYAAAKAERDQLVKDLVAYEEHAAAIVQLLDRLSRNTIRIQSANSGASAETWLYSAQMIARGADHEFGIQHDSLLPNLIDGVKLPNFRKNQARAHGYVWPPASY
ncbi:hypothetical protein EPK99_25005 [Neorhizobium lilium]|uniref:Uncharacterized protein n=1 Tax=Neorhizobium lilium TaxID=2503024 RepID=A0A3S4UIB5_9HYPH|nr:hypothetical protein [Neorhizobium lilium]RWX74446.1 hypothetical protein EPK99_25005 [Neorhizobium lilium]